MLSVSGQCTEFPFSSMSKGPLATAPIDLREISGISLLNLINVLIDTFLDDFLWRAIQISELEFELMKAFQRGFMGHWHVPDINMG